MGDSPLPDTDDGRHDYPRSKTPGVRRERHEDGPSRAEPAGNRLTIYVAVGSLLMQLGGVAWYGGELKQRVSSVERQDQEHNRRLEKQDEKLEKVRSDIAQQSNAIAANNVAYADIIRRLQSIENKLDRR